MNKEFLPSAYDTSDSFYPSAEFNYHQKKGDYECRIMLDNRQRAIDALLVNPTITKQHIEELISYIQKDADVMINQLLTEATDLRQKLRTQNTKFESIIRQLKTKIRSLSQENLQMTSELQIKQRIYKEEVNELKKRKKEEKNQRNNLHKQIEGIQGLLNEYQNQLQKKDRQIEQIRKQLQEKSAFCQSAKTQILDQSTFIEQLKSQIYYLEREYKTQEIVNSTQKKDQINLLLHKDMVLQNQVSDREFLIRCLSEEGVKKEKQIDNLKEILAKLKNEIQAEKANKEAQKNKQKNSIVKLQNASDSAILSIKEKYNLKLQKIIQIFTKQLKKLKKQIQLFKTVAIKQMQLCQKQTKGILISQLKAFYSK